MCLSFSWLSAVLSVWFSWQYNTVYRLCCGFQFALQFVTFNLLLQYVCHSVDCQLYCQFGSAESTVLYTDCVLWFQFALQLVTFNIYSITVCVSCSWLSLALHWLLQIQLSSHKYRASYWLQLREIRTNFHRALHW